MVTHWILFYFISAEGVVLTEIKNTDNLIKQLLMRQR